MISNLDHFLEFGPQTHTQSHTPSRVGSGVKGSGSGPGSAHNQHTQSALGDTGGPSRKAKSAGTPKKRVVSRSKAVGSGNNNSSSNNVTSGYGHNGNNNFNNTNHTSVNNTHNTHTNSSSDHQPPRSLSAHRARAQTVGHNLENRGVGDGPGSGFRGDRKQSNQQQEKHSTPSKGQAQAQGQAQGQGGYITHTPLAHTLTSTMPFPSSRYEEQLRSSFESLVFESITSAEQETARARPPAPHMRGSPQRPRSAPSPASGSPMSLRFKGSNAGLGLGLDGTSSGAKEARGGGIAAMGRGETNRRVPPRSQSTDRSAVRHDAGRDGQGQGQGTRTMFTDSPIYLPQRISGRPPMTPSHAHTPLAPNYIPHPRAAPHSTMKSTSNRPPPHSSVPSYARV